MPRVSLILQRYDFLSNSQLHDIDPEKVFAFADYQSTRKRLDKMLEKLKSGIQEAIERGIRSEWDLANEKNDALCDDTLGKATVARLSQQQHERYYNRNNEALEAFLKRKRAGMNLSDRVWLYTKQFKEEIELGLDIGIRSGRSADEMSRDIRAYLKNPDKLFRRVRNEHGQLVLSKRAAAYHPGRGVYRSSYKNARRLAATEVNIAYRTSDHERWQQLDFVVGIHVLLSNNHTLNGRPFFDICDELSGKNANDKRGRYPKDFKFTGWHPLCRCHVISILKTDEELVEDNRRILAGKEPSSESVNTVKKLPDEFTGWVKDNTDRIKRAKTMPYFIKDNEKAVKKIMRAASSSTAAKTLTPPVFKETIEKLKQQGVNYLEAKDLKKSLSEAEIIERIGGGDLTAGSCSSLAFAYAGNVCGFDVLDFRDGASRRMFSRTSTIMDIAEQAGGVVVKHTNDFTKAKQLLQTVETGKQYYFTCGKHAAIVRKNENGFEYLELQSRYDNGFKPLSDAVLKRRFGAQKSHTSYGSSYETSECIIDIELLRGSSDFKKLLGYINTLEQAQRKGKGGSIK